MSEAMGLRAQSFFGVSEDLLSSIDCNHLSKHRLRDRAESAGTAPIHRSKTRSSRPTWVSASRRTPGIRRRKCKHLAA
jgi:hypothetical protein